MSTLVSVMWVFHALVNVLLSDGHLDMWGDFSFPTRAVQIARPTSASLSRPEHTCSLIRIH